MQTVKKSPIASLRQVNDEFSATVEGERYYRVDMEFYATYPDVPDDQATWIECAPLSGNPRALCSVQTPLMGRPAHYWMKADQLKHYAELSTLVRKFLAARIVNGEEGDGSNN